jgi:hypothetical protein
MDIGRIEMATNILVESLPVTAAPGSNALLFDRLEEGADPNGTSAQASIGVGPYRCNALILANAYGFSHYRGPTANAGITIILSGNGEAVRDDSFEGESSNIGFNAQASLLFVLPAGQVREIETNLSPMGAGGRERNRETSVKLHVVALAV